MISFTKQRPATRRGHKVACVFAAAFALSLLSAGNAFADYTLYETDGLENRSSDGKAKAKGTLYWYHGEFPKGYIHRGDYGRDAKVRATKRVGCIWVKVTYGYPNGELTVGPGGPAGGVSGGSYAGKGLYVKCRKRGRTRPKAISLYGIGYAKAFLNSSTLQICTSRNRRQGPRFCSWEKNVYGGS